MDHIYKKFDKIIANVVFTLSVLNTDQTNFGGFKYLSFLINRIIKRQVFFYTKSGHTL